MHTFHVAGSRRSNARLSMVDFMPFSRDLSQEQLIGYIDKCITPLSHIWNINHTFL